MNSPSHPTCEAYGERIHHTLPADCPMRAEAACRQLTTLLDESFALIHERDHGRITEGLWLIQRVKGECYDCIGRLSWHPTIKALRRGPDESTRTTNLATAQAETPEPRPSHPAVTLTWGQA